MASGVLAMGARRESKDPKHGSGKTVSSDTIPEGGGGALYNQRKYGLDIGYELCNPSLAMASEIQRCDCSTKLYDLEDLRTARINPSRQVSMTLVREGSNDVI